MQRDNWRTIFEPEQLCISEKGTEKCIHLSRNVISVNRDDPEWIFVTLDIENAYNTFDRLEGLKGIQQYTPELLKYEVFKYNERIPLFMTDGSKIYSSAGRKQGDTTANLGLVCGKTCKILLFKFFNFLYIIYTYILQ